MDALTRMEMLTRLRCLELQAQSEADLERFTVASDAFNLQAREIADHGAALACLQDMELRGRCRLYW